MNKIKQLSLILLLLVTGYTAVAQSGVFGMAGGALFNFHTPHYQIRQGTTDTISCAIKNSSTTGEFIPAGTAQILIKYIRTASRADASTFGNDYTRGTIAFLPNYGAGADWMVDSFVTTPTEYRMYLKNTVNLPAGYGAEIGSMGTKLVCISYTAMEPGGNDDYVDSYTPGTVPPRILYSCDLSIINGGTSTIFYNPAPPFAPNSHSQSSQQVFGTISGKVFNDANGNSIIDGAEATAKIASPMWVYLANVEDQQDPFPFVIDKVKVAADGTYSFWAEPYVDYKLLLSTDSTIDPLNFIDPADVSTTLPVGWARSAENKSGNNTGSGDGTPDGIIVQRFEDINLSQRNFGIRVFATDPDVNQTYVNVPVPGNVSTNDDVPPGTTYTGVTSKPGNPAVTTPVLNTDGTYTFTPTVPGVYTFNVTVCTPAPGTQCKPELLTITVLDKTSLTNPPVANTDIASTKKGVPVTIKSLANDAAGQPGFALVPATVTITDLNGGTAGNTAQGGTVTVDASGNTTYTPATGFTGTDTVKYTVCDNQSPAQCASAFQIITVIDGQTILNTTVAADDYVTTPKNTPATGNVKTNDSDPEGDSQTVTAQNTTIPGKGTLVLATDGTYTFTPVAGYTGPVEIPYTTCDNNATQACAKATLHVMVSPSRLSTDPDVNETYVNVPVTGNVSTNDDVPPGTTYTGVTSKPGNPAVTTPVLNTDGTYTFTPTVPGVYTFDVTVCVPAPAAECKSELLTITVLDKTSLTNPPVANTDIATTKKDTPVTIKALANDAAGQPGFALVPATVTITDLNGGTAGNTAQGGTVTVDASGNTTYTPATGFTGTDTVKYTVCDNQSPAQCASALQVITVIDGTTTRNTTVAADDYLTTPINIPATGNVKTNDSDPEGNTQTVAAQNTTIPGKGTLVLATDGTYTFTPVTGYTGPVEFTYTTCDNNATQACAKATLHVMVSPSSLHTDPDVNETYVNVPVTGNVSTNDEVPPGTTYTGVTSKPGNPAVTTPVLNTDGTYTFTPTVPGVYTFDITVCTPAPSAECKPELLTITVLDKTILTNPPVANTDIATTKKDVPVTIKSLANDAAGQPGFALVPATVTITDLNGGTAGNTAQGGTVTVDASGNTTYTPATGFTGTDTVKYTVCDNQSPAQCASAFQVITVIDGTTTRNTTVAADDYVTTPKNTPATGNVKSNDSDPEGNTQTVAAQNTTIPGKGTLVLATDGTYTFTPITGYTGPVEFTYTTCDNNATQACAKATLHVLVSPSRLATDPDVNETYVNVPVTGNVSTNDDVPPGTTYTGVTSKPGNPAVTTPVLNTDGTYTFTPTVPGVYTFDVTVCTPAPAAECKPELLTITVLDKTILTNPPVANTDIATTKKDTPVTIKALANDAAGQPGFALVPGTVTITDLNGGTAGNTAQGGTVTVDASGNTTYTPATGFTGTDTVKYTVCDNQSPAQCASAFQVITVIDGTTTRNTTVAADDYLTTPKNTPATGSVKTNDNDPEGDTQTVTAQNTTIAGKGTLVLATDGTYTFTPVAGYTGPVEFTYTTCDNNATQVCAKATLHVMVSPTVTIAGTMLQDANGLSGTPANTVDGTGTNAGGTLNAVLIDTKTGKVVATTSVSATGTYSFAAQNPGNYNVQVTTATATIGSTPPAVTLPAGWVSTGEHIGAGAGSDGTADGILPLGNVTDDLSNVNLGIEQIPTAVAQNYLITSPSLGSFLTLNGTGTGTGNSPGALRGSDPEDQPTAGSLSTKKISITSLPTHGELWYNGAPVTATGTISNYDPALLQIKFIGGGPVGYTSASFDYAYVDAADKPSTPVNYLLIWAQPLPIELIDFSAVANGCDVELNWKTGVEDNVSNFDVLRSDDGVNFKSVATVSATGSNSTYNQHVDGKTGTLFFKLKMNDVDSKISYSNIVKVNTNCRQTVSLVLVPNPAQNQVTIQGLASDDAVQVTNVNGQVVIPSRVLGSNVLSVQQLTPGFYTIIITGKNGEMTKLKLVKE